MSFWSLLFMQDFSAKKETSRESSSSTLWEDHEPFTNQDTKWTQLQMAQGSKHEAIKLRGPEQKMQELAQQVNDIKGPHAEGLNSRRHEKQREARRGRDGLK
jgi:hypothetical protein